MINSINLGRVATFVLITISTALPLKVIGLDIMKYGYEVVKKEANLPTSGILTNKDDAVVIAKIAIRSLFDAEKIDRLKAFTVIDEGEEYFVVASSEDGGKRENNGKEIFAEGLQAGVVIRKVDGKVVSVMSF